MKQVIQRAFQPCPNPSPKNNQPLLRVGRVIEVNQAQNTVTLAMMGGEGVLFNVPVIGGVSSTLGGMNYLPKPIKENDDDADPAGRGKKDIFAIVGFINGVGTMPVVLGFKHPEVHQLSFDGVGFENHQIERHDSDRYHRIVGDAQDSVPCEEEYYWPDGSYFKVWDGSKDLTDLTGKNQDSETQPFKVKSDDSAKGFYFQHSSGAKIYIEKNGDIFIQGPSGLTAQLSGEVVTFSGGSFVFNGDMQVNGSITASGSITGNPVYGDLN
jgi:hypothetical protein